ncbi:MAG TPA: phosphoribosyltransferase family protein [Anaerolineae bacterium]|nr:phosphoribosyltransferase family protein [Anaerolineae bacterium]HOQ98823.1 phosphoribosyltransferase family protein [Anaerolineae bacterium]HPL28037.1 phosphoribosyltransferase family protein [Anaerolineae bacterium]
MQFVDRRDAGRRLAEALGAMQDRPGLLILAVPRGGVVVGVEVARALKAPLDIVIARKIGAPDNPELAIGAVAPDGTAALDEDLVARLGVSDRYIQVATEQARQEIDRRLQVYRNGRPPLQVRGKNIVLVDDGVATGATTLAAIRYLRKQEPAELTLAVPVGPPDTMAMLSHEVDRAVVLYSPELFWAVGAFYQHFEQTSDEEVVELLREMAAETPSSSAPAQ